MVRGQLVATCALVLHAFDALGAQQPPTLRLETPEGQAPHEYLEIAALRVLPNGELLVADARDERLFRFSPSTGERRPIGRKGSGPGEYLGALALVALRADTTVFPDMANGRWHLLVGERIVATWSAEHPWVARVRGGLTGADDRGHLYLRRRLSAATTIGPFRADSLALVRFSTETSREDTIVRLRSRPSSGASSRAAQANPLAAQAFGIPMLVGEQALAYPDGWVATVRLNPYRVEWLSPSGTVVRGPSIPVQTIKVTEEEKAAFQEREQRDLGRPVRVSSSHPWPEEADPVEDAALVAAADGALWVRLRSPAKDSTVTYQVIGRDGRVRMQVVMPRDLRVLALSSGRAYVRTIDDDGYHRLEWYRIPIR